MTAAPVLPTRILSMREPWLWAITGPLYNPKRIENRRWNAHYRGPILLHRSRGTKPDDVVFGINWMAERGLVEPFDGRWPGLDSLPRGGICAYAQLDGVIPPEWHRDHSSTVASFRSNVPDADAMLRWHMTEQYGFVLRDVRPLPFIPWPGALNLFKAPDVLADACLGALNGACPCNSELDDPGPTHLATCPYSDPDFDDGGVL